MNAHRAPNQTRFQLPVAPAFGQSKKLRAFNKVHFMYCRPAFDLGLSSIFPAPHKEASAELEADGRRYKRSGVLDLN
jgi:hypothetical protein